MFEKTLRAIGAGVVLVAIGGAALAQMGDGGRSSAISPVAAEISATIPPASTAAANTIDESTSTTLIPPEPFTYRIGVLAGITTDNFWAFYGEAPSVWNAYILGPTKPALYAPGPEGGSLDPELAREMVVPVFDETGWRVLVRLNPDLYWSDGVPVTAEDVVFTFDTVRRLGLGGSWADAYPSTIDSMWADSPYQLRIEFAQRPTVAVWPQAVGTAPVMPAHIWGPLVDGLAAEDLYALSGAGDVSGGPLELREVENELIVSTANPGYPLASPPERVEYRVFSAEGDAVAALDAGDIDYLLTPKGLTPSEVESLVDNGAITVETSPSNGIRYLGFNLDRAPMSLPEFRVALALLLDREAISEADPFTGPVAYGFVGPENGPWYDAEAAAVISGLYAGDLASRLNAAVEGLVDAGYSWTTPPRVGEDGTVIAGTGLRIDGAPPSPLTILTSGDTYDPSRPRYAAEIARVLGWLGFDARPVETDFDTVVDLTFTPGEDGSFRYDMYLLGWTLGNPGLPGHYRPLFAADGVMNNTGYDSATFAAELAAYEGAYTLSEARDALWSMEITLARDLPYLLLFRSQITEAYRADRVQYAFAYSLGGIQGRLGGIGDVTPAE